MGIIKKLIRKTYYWRNICPDCKCKSIGWGQWNDGHLAGKPICFNPNCPEISPYESHWTKKQKIKYVSLESINK